MSYKVPLLRVGSIDLGQILERRLYFLLPFYIFRYEKELDAIESDASRIRELEEIYREIREHLEAQVANGGLSPLSFGVIMDTTKMVLKKIADGHKGIIGKVGGIMGGKVLDLEILRYKHAMDEANRRIEELSARAKSERMRADRERARAEQGKEEIEQLRAEIRRLRATAGMA